MVIGKKLQKRRKELNLSRAQLAEMVHVTASAIANYENSISYPKPDILISLILALKIDANYLFEDYLKRSNGFNDIWSGVVSGRKGCHNKISRIEQ